MSATAAMGFRSISREVQGQILSNLLPFEIFVEETRGDEEVEFALASLGATERASVLGSAEIRQRHFALGRLCARRALSRLGAPPGELVQRKDRSPEWPVGIIGSITHTKGYCAAAVARMDRYAGIGVDAESRPVDSSLWDQICTNQELLWLLSQPDGSRATMATLIFSAKEAVYKCQRCWTQGWLDFQDVTTAIDEIEFHALVSSRTRPDLGGLRFSGRYAILADMVVTAVAMPCGFASSANTLGITHR